MTFFKISFDSVQLDYSEYIWSRFFFTILVISRVILYLSLIQPWFVSNSYLSVVPLYLAILCNNILTSPTLINHARDFFFHWDLFNWKREHCSETYISTWLTFPMYMLVVQKDLLVLKNLRTEDWGLWRMAIEMQWCVFFKVHHHHHHHHRKQKTENWGLRTEDWGLRTEDCEGWQLRCSDLYFFLGPPLSIFSL